MHLLGAGFSFKAIEEGNLSQILVLRLETEQSRMRISEHWLHKMELSVPAIMSEQPQDFVNLMEFIILNCLKKEKKSCFYTLLNSTLASELLIKRERKAENHRGRGSTFQPLSLEECASFTVHRTLFIHSRLPSYNCTRICKKEISAGQRNYSKQ